MEPSEKSLRLLERMLSEQQWQIRMLGQLNRGLVKAHFVLKEFYGEMREQHRTYADCLKERSVAKAPVGEPRLNHRPAATLFHVLDTTAVAQSVCLFGGGIVAHGLLSTSSASMRLLEKATVSDSCSNADEAPVAPAAAALPICFQSVLLEEWQYDVVDRLLSSMDVTSIGHFFAVSHATRDCVHVQGQRTARRFSSADGCMPTAGNITRAFLLTPRAATPDACCPAADAPSDAGEPETPPPALGVRLEARWRKALGAALDGQARRAGGREPRRRAEAERRQEEAKAGRRRARSPARPSEATAATVTDTSRRYWSASPLSQFVKLEGLRRRADLNGMIGRYVPEAYPADHNKRLLVQLRTGHQCQHVRVWPHNLEFLTQAKATTAPSFNWPASLVRRVFGLTGCKAAYNFMAASHGALDTVRSQGKVYVCGGRGEFDTALRTMDCYDTVEGTWTEASPMLRLRSEASSVVCSGYFYVCGGRDDRAILDCMERFDPRTGAWTAMPRLPSPRMGASLVAISGLIYVCGGSVQASALSVLDCFDPKSMTWKSLPPMTTERACLMVCTFQKRLYAVGGSNGQFLRSMEVFDTLAERWGSCPAMRKERACSSSLVIGKQWYVLGGSSGPPLKVAERYDLIRQAWEHLPPMQYERLGAATAMAQTPTRIFVCGGCKPGDPMEIFHVSTRTWEAVHAPRCVWCFGVTAEAAGQLYVCGGVKKTGACDTVGRLNFRNRQWEELPSLPRPRAYGLGFIAPV